MSKAGYNKYYFLLKVKAVNEMYMKYKEYGATSKFIYDHHIKNQFFISRTTFYTYLSIPYKKELEALEKVFGNTNTQN